MTESFPQGLPDPGLPIVLTMKTTYTGETSINYTVSPEEAAALLRLIASKIEEETSA